MKGKELSGLRPPEFYISDRLSALLRGGRIQRCLRLRLVLSQGPCHDDWCEPLRRVVAEIVEDTAFREDDVRLIVNGICLIIDSDLYYSASKLRDKVFLDAGRSREVRVKGFSAF